MANVDNAVELDEALAGGSDGVGLVRTELWLKENMPHLEALLRDHIDHAAREEFK